MERIRRIFSALTVLDDDDWTFFASRLRVADFPKKAVVLRQGDVEQHLSFVEYGVLRLYMPQPEKEVTFGFAFPDGFVSAYDSFLTRKPAGYAVQALTDTRLWRIAYDDLQAVYAHTRVGHEIGRKNAEQLYLAKVQRELSLLSRTASERYEDLFAERPELIRQIPLQYIAAYIGITPQALSRIRRRRS